MFNQLKDSYLFSSWFYKFEDKFKIHLYFDQNIYEFNESGDTELLEFVKKIQSKIQIEDFRFYQNDEIITLDGLQKDVWNLDLMKIYIDSKEYSVETSLESGNTFMVKIVPNFYDSIEIVRCNNDEYLESMARFHFKKSNLFIEDETDLDFLSFFKEIAKGVNFLFQMKYLVLCQELTKTINPFNELMTANHYQNGVYFGKRPDILKNVCQRDMFIFRDFNVFQYDEETIGFYVLHNHGPSKIVKCFKGVEFCEERIVILSKFERNTSIYFIKIY